MSEVRNCVILFSKAHFNPQSESDLSNSSSGIIAKSVYSYLKSNESFNVVYFDYSNIKEWVKIDTEVLISLVESFDLARWFFKPRYSFIFVVNQHPMQRLLILKQARSINLPGVALSGTDGIYQPIKSISKFNGIIYVGNDKVAKSFEKFYSSVKMYKTYYHSQFEGSKKTYKITEKSYNFNILILMSEISFRKGFDVICSLIRICNLNGLETNFHIVGSSKNEYWIKLINKLTSTNNNVKYHGWVGNKSNEFNILMSQMSLAIFPSREEGMLGALIECIEKGIPSMHTLECGISLSNESLGIDINDIDDFFLKVKHFGNLDELNRDLLLVDQQKLLQIEMEESKSIDKVLTQCLEELSNDKSKLNIVSVISEFDAKSVYFYFKIYLNRFKNVFLSKNKKKLALFIAQIKT